MKGLVFIALLTMLTATAGVPLVYGQRTAAQQSGRLSVADSDYTRVKVFGVEGTGNKFVYLFDRSGSMEGAPLAEAKKQLLESLHSLGETQRFDIIFFNHRMQVFNSSASSRRSPFATERNKKLAADFLAAARADGGTDRMAALKHALALRPDVVFFLSDADRPMLTKELDEIAELNDRVGAQICAIEFGHGAAPAGESSLETLAKSNRGQYVYINTDKFTK